MRNTFKKLIFLLNHKERREMYLLIFMILIMALLDMIGVASILPFMIVLTNPDITDVNPTLNKMFEISNLFGVETNQEFLFGLGMLVFIILTLSLSFKALTFYLQLKFIAMREYSIGKRLVEGYLNQPYSWFLNRHSTDLGKNILSEVSIVIGDGLAPIISLIAHSAVVAAIISLLVVSDPTLALMVCLVLGLAYYIVYIFTKSLLSKIGQGRLDANRLRFSSLSEAFGAAKEVKLGGLEKIFVKRFSEPAKNFSNYKALLGALGQLPRYAIEIIIFGGMLLVILYLMADSKTFNSLIPIISLYAFAGYRLIPAIQQIYNSITRLRSVDAALNSLHDDLKDLQPKVLNKYEGILKVKKNITLKNVYYNYPNSSRTALKGININIQNKTTVGFVGPTGSGKTTTVDIILGLIQAQKGTLEVDNKVINNHNLRSWQNSIGYVPQNIYLSDDTIASNISFGTDFKDIDQKSVEDAAKIANLHDFIINELPDKYKTFIGERGIRLSGGQRQRIGIARALYHKPEILVLDEATSSLDNLTEQEVMEAINRIGKEVTIILIAHRLSTVKNCDNIFFLENGKVVGNGTYDQLLETSATFRKNAEKI